MTRQVGQRLDERQVRVVNRADELLERLKKHDEAEARHLLMSALHSCYREMMKR